LFFARLRAHAKWMFVLLAIVFALGFVVFGVGSGSNGVSSALQNAFNFGGGTTGPSISSLQKKVAAHPNDAASWRALATAYETKHEPQLAITALEKYTALKPKDTSALQELASQYTSLADTYNTQAQNAEVAAQTANLAPSFLPSSSSTIGKAFTTGGPLDDPLSTANVNTATSTAQAAVSQLDTVESEAESAYERLAKLTPTDASVWIQLGQAAQGANDTATAVAAYKRFLKLAPTDPLAPQVRAVLKQLAPAKK
jgi:cytochrome c-type biogenesis protein CcmH/NrfG